MTLKQESGEPVAKYVGRAKDLERKLLAARAEVKPEDLAMSVITSLSKEFDMLVTVLVAADAVKSIDEMLPTAANPWADWEVEGKLAWPGWEGVNNYGSLCW